MKTVWRLAVGLVAAAALNACAHRGYYGYRYSPDYDDHYYEEHCRYEHRHRLSCGHRVTCHYVDGRHHYDAHRCSRGYFSDGCRRY